MSGLKPTEEGLGNRPWRPLNEVADCLRNLSSAAGLRRCWGCDSNLTDFGRLVGGQKSPGVGHDGERGVPNQTGPAGTPAAGGCQTWRARKGDSENGKEEDGETSAEKVFLTAKEIATMKKAVKLLESVGACDIAFDNYGQMLIYTNVVHDEETDKDRWMTEDDTGEE